MKIHGLCLIKNEADVIAECLTAACAWCDHIYVRDNGSTDGTWEIVKTLASSHPQIVPYKQDNTMFHDGLRRELFMAFAGRAQADDWWCRLDADEFYVEKPRVFLCKIPDHYGIVWSASLSFYFSSADAESYRHDPSRFADDIPVGQKCRFYFNHWSEIRFVRHRDLQIWPATQEGWPKDIAQRARSCPIRILVKHYPYRSPQQIERRIATRSASAVAGKVFQHEAIANWSATVEPSAVQRHRWKDLVLITDPQKMERTWESRVINASSLNYDAHDDRYVINEHLMPPIPDLDGRGKSSQSGQTSLRRRTADWGKSAMPHVWQILHGLKQRCFPIKQ